MMLSIFRNVYQSYRLEENICKSNIQQQQKNLIQYTKIVLKIEKLENEQLNF